MKYKIRKRRGLSLRKPWELIYPTGEALKFRTFEDARNQLRLLYALFVQSWLTEKRASGRQA